MENQILLNTLLELTKNIDAKTNGIVERLAVLETEVRAYSKPIDEIPQIKIQLANAINDVSDLNEELAKIGQEKQHKITLNQGILLAILTAGLSILSGFLLQGYEKPATVILKEAQSRVTHKIQVKNPNAFAMALKGVLNSENQSQKVVGQH